jgi:hypothetical protein
MVQGGSSSRNNLGCGTTGRDSRVCDIGCAHMHRSRGAGLFEPCGTAVLPRRIVVNRPAYGKYRYGYAIRLMDSLGAVTCARSGALDVDTKEPADGSFRR